MNKIGLLVLERIVIPAVVEYLEKKEEGYPYSSKKAIKVINDKTMGLEEKAQIIVDDPGLKQKAIDAVEGFLEVIFG